MSNLLNVKLWQESNQFYEDKLEDIRTIFLLKLILHCVESIPLVSISGDGEGNIISNQSIAMF